MMQTETNSKTPKYLKFLRRWSRILHRDFGFFFFGTSIIYALSGFALNHLKDWNPSYFVTISEFNTDRHFEGKFAKEEILGLMDELGVKEEYKTHYFPKESFLKVYFKGGSTMQIDLNSGKGIIEHLKKKPLFFESNYLHYNPNKWWTLFSDLFAFSLFLFAITSLFMVRGKKGPLGRGGIYIIVGIVIPILILLFT